jgi:hypothetical protein
VAITAKSLVDLAGVWVDWAIALPFVELVDVPDA